MDLKYSWYQSIERVYIDIFERDVVSPLDAHIINGTDLAISIGGIVKEYLTLSHPVRDVSIVKRSTKVSIELEKQEQLEWQTLCSNDSTNNKCQIPRPSPSSTFKNWDSLLMGEDDDRSKEDINDFFRKLYEQGDDDTKRAMLKSMVESGGTVLSTNWKDVGKKNVERRPFEGTD